MARGEISVVYVFDDFLCRFWIRKFARRRCFRKCLAMHLIHSSFNQIYEPNWADVLLTDAVHFFGNAYMIFYTILKHKNYFSISFSFDSYRMLIEIYGETYILQSRRIHEYCLWFQHCTSPYSYWVGTGIYRAHIKWNIVKRNLKYLSCYTFLRLVKLEKTARMFTSRDGIHLRVTPSVVFKDFINIQKKLKEPKRIGCHLTQKILKSINLEITNLNNLIKLGL